MMTGSMTMTDDLVKRHVEQLRLTGGDLADLCHPLADRIEALTAERDVAYARGYADAETEISKSALGQKNDFLHSQYANALNRIEALTAERDEVLECNEEFFVDNQILKKRIEKAEAERDRLRGGIEYVLDGYGLKGPDYRFQDGEDGDWITDHLIAVMKGETP